MESINFVGALTLGIMGAGHCMAMCGGIISTLSMVTGADESAGRRHLFLYQFGRIFSYSLIGAIAGSLGFLLDKATTLPFLQVFSGTLLIAMALYISIVWMVLSSLERIGKILWNRISPLSKKLLPVKNNKQALLLGALWGWLPCGLVYTSLAYAITLSDSVQSSLFMLAFGLGTLPATLVLGEANKKLKKQLNSPVARYLLAVLFFSWGCFTLYSALFTQVGHHH